MLKRQALVDNRSDEKDTMTKTYLSTVENLYCTLGTHDGNFCTRPSVVGVSTEVLTGHDIVCSSVGFSGDNSYLGYAGLCVCKEESISG